MKKILFLFAMMLAVAGAQAKVDKFACNQTLSSSYSWTGANKSVQLFESLSSVDKSKYKYLHVKVSNKVNIEMFTVRIMCAGNYSTASWHKDYYTSTDITINLTEETYKDENTEATARTYSDISRIYLVASSKDTGTEASFDINASDVYLSTEEYEAMDITTTINSTVTYATPFQWYKGDTSTPMTESNKPDGFGSNIGKTTSGTIVGYPNNNSLNNGYFDVTGYDMVTVTLGADFDADKNNLIRLLAGEGTTNSITCSAGNTVYAQPLTVTKCTSIKAGAGASTCQNVSTIDFTKSFNAEGATAFNIAKSSSSTVAYDRTFTAGQNSTVCLPFALTEDEAAKAGKFYELTDCDGSSLTFKEVTETEAYKPYLFVPAGATPFASLTDKEIPATAATYATTAGSATFQGTLKKETVASGVYGYSATEGKFVKVTGTEVTINAFRAYITVAGGAQSLDIDLGGTTGISTVKTQVKDNDNTIYNLNGQRVGTDYKGIVIKNGKKVIVK